jgi:hypothetical protein
LALTAALITSSTFLPRACSSMYSWMLMLSFGEDRIGAVRRLVRRVVMGARRAVGAEKAAEALIMNALMSNRGPMLFCFSLSRSGGSRFGMRI